MYIPPRISFSSSTAQLNAFTSQYQPETRNINRHADSLLYGPPGWVVPLVSSRMGRTAAGWGRTAGVLQDGSYRWRPPGWVAPLASSRMGHTAGVLQNGSYRWRPPEWVVPMASSRMGRTTGVLLDGSYRWRRTAGVIQHGLYRWCQPRHSVLSIVHENGSILFCCVPCCQCKSSIMIPNSYILVPLQYNGTNVSSTQYWYASIKTSGKLTA